MLDQGQRDRLDELDATKKRSAIYAYTATAVAGVGIAVGFTMVLFNQPRLVGATVARTTHRCHSSGAGNRSLPVESPDFRGCCARA
jgi:hypothetical protein